MHIDAIGSEGHVRRAHSQVVEGEQLRDTTEDYEYRNGEIHHATKGVLVIIFSRQGMCCAFGARAR